MTMGLKFPKHPYHIINLSFAGIFLLIFIYSGIFSAEKNNYPIKSACETITGKPCKSSGLSRSFSEIVRLRFESAKKYNPYSLKIFTFFLIQFFLRFFISLIIIKLPQHTYLIITLDAILAASLYIFCFWRMIF